MLAAAVPVHAVLTVVKSFFKKNIQRKKTKETDAEENEKYILVYINVKQRYTECTQTRVDFSNYWPKRLRTMAIILIVITGNSGNYGNCGNYGNIGNYGIFRNYRNY